MEKNYWEQIKNIGISGVWLFCLYVTLVILVIGTLGGYGFQKKLNSTKLKEGKEYTVNQFEKVNNDYISLKSQIKELSETLKNEKENKKNKEIELIKENEKLIGDQSKNYQLNSNIKFFTKEIENSKANINSSKEQISIYKKQLNEFDPVLALIHEFNFFGLYKWLYSMPIELLTLVLTMSMGALGSLIFITLEYFKEDTSKSFSWYFFRPFLGMVTALAIFVFAKAGQLTISDEGVSENLNPYFLSFLGIISGLVSEHATDKLRATGATFFQSDIDKKLSLDRWAISIEEQIKKQDKSVSELTQFVSASEKTVDDWVKEKKPVPVDEQKIIAAWLAVPRRQIFTDLPPSNDKLILEEIVNE